MLKCGGKFNFIVHNLLLHRVFFIFRRVSCILFSVLFPRIFHLNRRSSVIALLSHGVSRNDVSR